MSRTKTEKLFNATVTMARGNVTGRKLCYVRSLPYRHPQLIVSKHKKMDSPWEMYYLDEPENTIQLTRWGFLVPWFLLLSRFYVNTSV